MEVIVVASLRKDGWDISVCGLNCAQCGIMLLQKECAGCRGPAEKHWSPNCWFVQCSSKKGHEYCFQCDQFPCQELRAFASDGHAHHRQTIENMKEMKRLGIDGWIRTQDKPRFCPGWSE